MSKFKIGDKVIAKNASGVWKIIETNSGIGEYSYLCYQKGFYGHAGNDCSNKFREEGKYYSTSEYWYFNKADLIPCNPKFPEIRIVTDGKHTTATKFVDGEKVKEATVTLYYKDKFDFNIGAQEALKKLNSIKIIKRPKFTELEQKAIDLYKELGYNYIAKDRGGSVYVYEYKPIKKVYLGYWNSAPIFSPVCQIPVCLNFDSLSFEDTEPHYIGN